MELYYGRKKEIEFRNLDMEKVIKVLIELLAKQEGAVIEYTLEKVDKTIE